MSLKEQLIKQLTERSAVIGIIGLGYVGLPLAIRYAQVGYAVLGFDTDPAKPENLAAGRSYFKHIPDEWVKEAIEKGLSATSDFSRVAKADAAH